MKKFIVFIVSFILLFFLLVFSADFLSGVFLTSSYIPNVNEAWNSSEALPKQVELFSVSSPFSLNFLLALLAASAAYFISQRFPKRNHSNAR